MSSKALLAGVLGLVAACSPAAEAEWRPLAGRFRPGLEEPPVLERLDGGPELTLVHDGEHAWCRTALRRGDWERTDVPGVWSVAFSSGGRGRLRDGSPFQVLEAEGLDFRFAPGGDPAGWPRGRFRHVDGRLTVRLAEGEEPPERALFSCLAVGRRNADEARVNGRRFTGEGLSVWPGERQVLEVAFPPGAVLRFATTAEAQGREGAGVELTFRVRVDGAPVWESRLTVPQDGAFAWHAVELPAAGREHALLGFEVEGPPATSSFLAPGIDVSPAPTPSERPDVVLFLADTFRADGLRVYGGKDSLTPFLDDLAAKSLVFRRTWSTGTFTLPAHVSLFTARYPHQAGIIGTGQALPPDLTTLAEELHAAGYRTGAITDSVIVSQNYGMDHGFEWFDELKPAEGSLARTFERALAFLDADDGRPTFLFVHTYRTHLPYRVSDETRSARGIEGDFAELDGRLQEIVSRGQLDDAGLAERGKVVAGLEELYRGGVADLDRGLAGFYATLVERGLLGDEPGRGTFLFTSDHGEAFHEHDIVYHTGKVWEELARVPLLVSGPGIEPEVRQSAASLVDLPRTIAAIAGVEPAEGWLGADLLAQREDRPVYVFECQRPPSTLAVIEGPRKVIGFEDVRALSAGRYFAAFDLEHDPGEKANLLESRELRWARELLERQRGRVAQLLVPLVGPKAAELDPEKLAELKDLGYTGE